MLLSFSVLANSSTVSVSFSISRPLIGPLNVSAVWAETPLTLFGGVAMLSKLSALTQLWVRLSVEACGHQQGFVCLTGPVTCDEL